jgi:hypothetical protein
VKEHEEEGGLPAPVSAPDEEVPRPVDHAHGGSAQLGDPAHEDALDPSLGRLRPHEGVLDEVEGVEQLLLDVEGAVHDAHFSGSWAASASRRTSPERSRGGKVLRLSQSLLKERK